MNDEVAVLEPQADADASPNEVLQPGIDRDASTGRFIRSRYVDDSVDTAPEIEEPEGEPVEVEVELESEADPSPADDDAVDEIADDSPVETPGVQSRIDEITGKFRQTERIAQDLQAKLDEANAKLAAIPVKQEPMKTLEDFAFDGAAFTEYVMEESAKRAESTVERVMQKHQAKASAEQSQQGFREREKAFAGEHSDYFDMVYGETNGLRHWSASDAMASEIQILGNGHEIAYHLAKNPDIASEMAALSPRETVIAMDKLSTRIGNAAKKSAEKVVTKAPPPPPKLKTSGDAGIKQKGYHEGMTDAQFDAMRRKEIANR